jgi:hypothetical protein
MHIDTMLYNNDNNVDAIYLKHKAKYLLNVNHKTKYSIKKQKKH